MRARRSIGFDGCLAQLVELAAQRLVEFLRHDVRSTGSRVLYTSRQKVARLRSVEVLGFEGSELEGFVRLRAYEHGASCVAFALAPRTQRVVNPCQSGVAQQVVDEQGEATGHRNEWAHSSGAETPSVASTAASA